MTTLTINKKEVSKIRWAMDELLKQDMAALISVGNEIVKDIADEAGRGVSGIGSGSIQDSYSHNWSGSSMDRGKTGGRSENKYGVAKPAKAAKNRPVFVAGSGHPLAHIFELGTQDRRLRSNGARRGRITPRNTLNRAFKSHSTKVVPKLVAKFKAVKV